MGGLIGGVSKCGADLGGLKVWSWEGFVGWVGMGLQQTYVSLSLYPSLACSECIEKSFFISIFMWVKGSGRKEFETIGD